MRKLLIVFMLISLGASAQLKENVIRMKTVNSTFIEPYLPDQLIRIATDSTLFALTHATAIGQSMQTVFTNHWYKIIGGSGTTVIPGGSLWDYDRDSNIVNNNRKGTVRIKNLSLSKRQPTYAVAVYDSAGNVLTKYPMEAFIVHSDTIINNVSDTTGLDVACTGLVVYDSTGANQWFHRRVYNSSGALVGCLWTQLSSYNPFDTISGHIYQKDMGLSIELVGGIASNGSLSAGYGSLANNQSVAIGTGSQATGYQGLAINGGTASGTRSVAILGTASGESSQAHGKSINVSGKNSIGFNLNDLDSCNVSGDGEFAVLNANGVYMASPHDSCYMYFGNPANAEFGFTVRDKYTGNVASMGGNADISNPTVGMGITTATGRYNGFTLDTNSIVFGNPRSNVGAKVWPIDTLFYQYLYPPISGGGTAFIDSLFKIDTVRGKISVNPYPTKKVSDPGCPYFYSGNDYPYFTNNKLNLYGKLNAAYFSTNLYYSGSIYTNEMGYGGMVFGMKDSITNIGCYNTISSTTLGFGINATLIPSGYSAPITFGGGGAHNHGQLLLIDDNNKLLSANFTHVRYDSIPESKKSKQVYFDENTHELSYGDTTHGSGGSGIDSVKMASKKFVSDNYQPKENIDTATMVYGTFDTVYAHPNSSTVIITESDVVSGTFVVRLDSCERNGNEITVIKDNGSQSIYFISKNGSFYDGGDCACWTPIGEESNNYMPYFPAWIGGVWKFKYYSQTKKWYLISSQSWKYNN